MECSIQSKSRPNNLKRLFLIFTTRVRSTREGLFSQVSVCSHLGRSTYLLGGGGTYSQVWMGGGGGYLLSGLDGGGTYLLRSGQGGGTYSQVWTGRGGTYLPRSGQGGYLLSGLDGGGGTYSGLGGIYLGRSPPT